jgi:hypothetical protein
VQGQHQHPVQATSSCFPLQQDTNLQKKKEGGDNPEDSVLLGGYVVSLRNQLSDVSAVHSAFYIQEQAVEENHLSFVPNN